MTTVQAIEQAIQQLAPQDLSEFRQWFAKFDEAAWDAQIEADVTVGKLAALAAEAKVEFGNGNSREF
jgi:hypothetical protein